jgi:hypothetical protein
LFSHDSQQNSIPDDTKKREIKILKIG